MDVKAGYKQTEVGVIPVEWEVKPLNELFGFSGGFSASRDQLSSEGYCYLHYGDIHKSSKTYIDVRSEYQDIPKLDVPLKRISQGSLLNDGDVVFVDASEDDEGTSKHVVIVNKDKTPYISGLHTIVAKSKTNKLNPIYKRYCFQTTSIKSQFYFFAVGTKVSGISKTNIGKVILPLPLLSEQTAIAKALSDADAYIVSLEQLIAKKRLIKQGAMQELLTGKRRLPGFSGKWEEKQIGDFAHCVAGGTPSTLVPSYWGGTIPWMSSGELHRKYVNQVDGRITTSGLQNSSTQIVPEKSVLIGLAGQGKTRGTVALSMIELCTNQSIASIFPNPNYVPEYLYHTLDSRYRELRELSTGSGGRGGLNLTIIKSILVPFPTIEEQADIAQVLSDMDAEIDALGIKLSKGRQLKQGLMQELLTGRIRLI